MVDEQHVGGAVGCGGDGTEECRQRKCLHRVEELAVRGHDTERRTRARCDRGRVERQHHRLVGGVQRDVVGGVSLRLEPRHTVVSRAPRNWAPPTRSHATQTRSSSTATCTPNACVSSRRREPPGAGFVGSRQVRHLVADVRVGGFAPQSDEHDRHAVAVDRDPRPGRATAVPCEATGDRPRFTAVNAAPIDDLLVRDIFPHDRMERSRPVGDDPAVDRLPTQPVRRDRIEHGGGRRRCLDVGNRERAGGRGDDRHRQAEPHRGRP